MCRCLIAALLLGLAPAWACVKTLRWNEDPPYSMRLADGRIAGIYIETHQALLQRLGCRAELVEMPFARALAELQSGRLDLLPGAFDRPERRAYAWFSQAPVQMRNRVYVRQRDLPRSQGRSLQDLIDEGWRLGVQPGAVYGPAYAELLKDPAASARLQMVSRRASLWQMLDLGRVDAVPADELSASHELAAQGLAQRIVPSELVLSADAAGTAISRRNNDEAFLQRFDAALQAMRADGSLAALLRRYGLSTELIPN